jgi:hypothetical protein
MIYRIGIEYHSVKLIEDMTEEQYEALKKRVFGIPDDNKHVWNVLSDFMTDEAGLEALLALKLEVKLKQFKNTYCVPNADINNAESHNKVTHLHIPNLDLMSVNTIIVEDNSCTDTIQRLLNEGWKILAICPPNGARRPDYILGHFKHKDDIR